MDALRRLQDRDAIAQGIAEMDAGEGTSVEEARGLTRDNGRRFTLWRRGDSE
jgi:hypothetical protein